MGESGNESNLYFLQKGQTEKNEKDKPDTGKNTVLEIYSLKENSMIRNSLAFLEENIRIFQSTIQWAIRGQTVFLFLMRSEN